MDKDVLKMKIRDIIDDIDVEEGWNTGFSGSAAGIRVGAEEKAVNEIMAVIDEYENDKSK